jgi:hypothetical protein
MPLRGTRYDEKALLPRWCSLSWSSSGAATPVPPSIRGGGFCRHRDHRFSEQTLTPGGGSRQKAQIQRSGWYVARAPRHRDALQQGVRVFPWIDRGRWVARSLLRPGQRRAILRPRARFAMGGTWSLEAGQRSATRCLRLQFLAVRAALTRLTSREVAHPSRLSVGTKSDEPPVTAARRRPLAARSGAHDPPPSNMMAQFWTLVNAPTAEWPRVLGATIEVAET